MKQIDDVVRKAFNMEPKVASVKTQRAKSTIFEDELMKQEDDRIHATWYFHTPIATRSVVTVDLLRLLKQFDINQMGTDAKSLFTQFSSEVNRLKHLCVSQSAREEDILSYLNFIDVLNKVFENNSASYSYSVPSTDDSEPYYTIQSDKFLFEYLNTLLTLLAYYNNQALDIGLERMAATDTAMKRDLLRAESRLFHLCTEVFTEMLAQCAAPRAPHKLVYTEPPRSINRTTIAMNAERQTLNLPLKEFVCSFLGGEASIEARLHLCTAKKHEALSDLFMLATRLDAEEAVDAAISRMSAIHNAYTQAYTCIADSELNKTLYDHARFMAHLWFCRTHLFIVKQSSRTLLEALQNHDETEQELNMARELLTRLMFVTDASMAIEKNDRVMLDLLDADLKKAYLTLLEELHTLCKSFDVELWDNRHIKEMKGLNLTLPIPEVIKRQNSVLADARKETLKKCIEKQPAVIQAQQLLRVLLDKLIQSTSNDWLKTFSVGGVPTGESDIIVMDRSIRIGHLTEREWWLEYILSTYSLVDGQFVITADLHKVFTQELKAVRDAKTLVK